MITKKDPLNLTGKVAVVTGGSSGIGLGVVEILSAYGAKVAMVDISPKGEEKAEELRQAGRDVTFFKCDVTNEEQVKATIDGVVAKYGRIDGSGWGLKGGDLAAAYCAVKGGIVNVTRAMAIDHGPQNIRVNSVNPGDTDTAMLRDEGKQTGAVKEGASQMDAYLADCGTSRPLARIGMPEDIANAVLFLASDLSSWITGAALVVDGGGIA